MPDTPPLTPTRPRSRVRRFVRRTLALAGGLVVAAALTGWLLLRASLPPLDGTRPLAGLGAAVTIERDANGVPTVHAASREDAVRALGFLHAQDRFFQMDLLRRQSAGELAELFGAAALPADRISRAHRFRWRAGQSVERLPGAQRRLLTAYTAGVNAGLAALGARPWEYFLLNTKPRPWAPEDTVLVVDTMTMSLQAHDGLDERSRLAVRETYGDEALAFLRPVVREATAALDGSSQPAPPVPGAAQFSPRPGPADPSTAPAANPLASTDVDADPGLLPGSNNFALSGARVAGGGALVANDMHLGLSVPNTWYRASLVLPDRRVTGVSLPGTPGVVVGSNGEVAWGFTDAYLDASDVVIVETDPADPGRYRVPDAGGWERFEIVRDSIAVAHGSPDTLETVYTRWGPLLTRRDGAGRTLALHWTAHDPATVDLTAFQLDDAHSVDEALDIAHRAGLPAENFVVGDHTGHIAWTIIGPVPRRVGFDGQTPQSWADGTRRWDGYLGPEEIPVVRDPADGQLWTANNRVVGGEALTRLGNGGYDDPARAGQIRDDLHALAGRLAMPADGLAVQLDDESRFLFRWRDLLLTTLTDDAVTGQLSRSALRQAVRDWHGHAAVGEAGHRLVRDFRQNVMEAVMNPIYDPVRRHAPDLAISRTQFREAEQPLWSILTARPAWLLPPGVASWDALLLRAASATAAMGERLPGHPALRDCTWGKRNVLEMNHPFSRILPAWLARGLNMPAEPLPGDANMPRVQGPTFGASERMVVSPGRETEGIFHQPGGASGHPLSAFYRAGHEDWAQGRPTPFLPGATKYRLRLEPK